MLKVSSPASKMTTYMAIIYESREPKSDLANCLNSIKTNFSENTVQSTIVHYTSRLRITLRMFNLTIFRENTLFSSKILPFEFKRFCFELCNY